MLELIPTDAMATEYALTEHGRPAAWIEVSSFNASAVIVVDQVEYQARDGPTGPDGHGIVLSAEGRFAHCERRGMLRRQRVIVWGDREMTLKPRFGRHSFEILERDRPIGWIARDSSWGWRSSGEMPPDVPMLVKAFAMAVAVIGWKHG